LASVPAGPLGQTLIILVINAPKAAPAWALEANRSALEAVRRSFGRPVRCGEHIELLEHPHGDLLLVDRTRPGSAFSADQGVGLARKIGADIAVRLWADDALESGWIHCSDADVVLPADYFARTLGALGAKDSETSSATFGDEPAALVYDFEHLPEPDERARAAILRYEIFLRYYVLGLRSAGSPYAYHTIGSTIAFAPTAYVQVRGFSRRKAGEDFHLLAKLAKLGPIRALRGDPIKLSGRVSPRVPFGTGAGVARELQRIEEGRSFPVYDPRVFAWLGAWLRTLDSVGAPGSGERTLIRDRLLTEAAADPEVDAELLYELLVDVGAVRAAEASQERGLRHLHERFGALRTLKFIHELRDRHLPSITLEVAIADAPFIQLRDGWTLESARRTLANLEGEAPH
jgi:hypothetical protein